MAALSFRVRVWFNRRRLLVVGAGLLLGLSCGLAMGLVSGTRRTASAPDRYTSWAGGDPDLQVVQLRGAALTDAVSSIPGVSRVGGLSFVASFLRGPNGARVFEPNPFAGDDRLGGARVIQGRFTDPDKPDEFTANTAMADLLRQRFDSRIGDEFAVDSFDKSQLRSNRAFSSGEPPAVPAFGAKWVGVVQAPADFEEATPALYYSESFLAAHPTVGVVQTIMQIELAKGTDETAVMRAIQALPGGSGAFATGARIVSAESRRAVRFQASALWLVTGIALVGAALLVIQLIGRVAQLPDHEIRTLVALGLRSVDFATERAVRALACTIIAVPVALLVASAVTGPFPLGALSVFEPHRGPQLDWTVAAVGIVTMTVLAIAGSLLVARRDHNLLRARSAGIRQVIVPRGGMPLAVGAHFVTVGPSGARRSVVSLAAGIVGMAGLIGAGIVALNLDAIVTTPNRWGVNYDKFFGNPYVETERDIVTPVLRDPGVAKLTAAHVGSLNIDGRDTPTLAVDAIKGGLFPTILEGRPPTRSDEISLGQEVAHRLHVTVGDRVSVVGTAGAKQSLAVVGIVVTPDAAGGGASVTFDEYRALNPTATRNVLLARLSPHASAAEIDRIANANFSPPDAMPMPASVQALRRVLPAPLVLVIVLSVLLIAGCAFLLTLSVRARRRDVAVLRALGARPRQLRAIVHWQATFVSLTIVAAGVPLGIVLGQWIVHQLTGTLGIVPGVDLRPLQLLAAALATIGAANALALLPARRAARPSNDMLNREQ